MQMTIDGRSEPVPKRWPPELSAEYQGVVCEIEYTATVRIVVSGKSREEIEDAARFYYPDYADGTLYCEIGRVTAGDPPDFEIANGRIVERSEDGIDLSEIPQSVYLDEIERRAREDYGHLTESHAQDCALRDLRIAIGNGEWPA